MQCTVSEILAEIDHKGDSIPFHTIHILGHTIHILGQDWFHNKEATGCNKFGQHFVTTE